MLPRRFVLLLSLMPLLGVVQSVHACSCGQTPTVLEEFARSEEVVIVSVLSVEKVEEKDLFVDDVRSTTVIVEKVFKGTLKIRDEIVFRQGGGADCIWTFNEKSVGGRYLFYLARPERFTTTPGAIESDMWVAFGCGRSTDLAGASEDLLYLEKMKQVQGKTRISGTYGGWQNPDLASEGKKVNIIGPKKTYEVKTNKDGVFEIYDLPPGKYVIEPEIPAGWKLDPYWLRYSPSVELNMDLPPKEVKQVEITLAPRKHASVQFVFDVDSYVRGRVIGPKGKPLHNVCVYLLTLDALDRYGPFDCTDENGRFVISSAPPGEYVLVANHDSKLSPSQPFRRIFYPGVAEAEHAALINVGLGGTVDNIDLVVPKLEELITIQGVLTYSNRKPVAEEWVKFRVGKENETTVPEIREKTDRSGRFTLRVLKGFSGELFGEDWIRSSETCAEVEEFLAKSGNKTTTVASNVIKVTTEQDVFDVELTLPFVPCERK